MRVCFLTTSYPRSPGDDAGIFVERLVAALAERVDAVSVVVPRDCDESLEEVRGKVGIFRYRYGLWRRGQLAFGLGIAPNIAARPTLVFQIPGLLLGMFRRAAGLRGTFDLLIANWISSGVVAYALHRCFGTPYIVVLRGGDVHLLKALPTFFSPVLRAAYRVIAVSESLRDELGAPAPDVAAAIEVIHNGVTRRSVSAAEVERFLAVRNLPLKRYLVFVGSVIPRKRIEHLIEMLAADGLIDYELVVCGRIGTDAYRGELVEQARVLGVYDRLRFEGLVPPHDIPLYLAGAAAYVSAAEFEGRPNGLLEAMAAGLPCVVSAIPPHRELIVDGESGLLFSGEARKTVGARLAEIFRSPKECARLGEAAQLRIAQETWEGCAERYLSIFNAAGVGKAGN